MTGKNVDYDVKDQHKLAQASKSHVQMYLPKYKLFKRHFHNSSVCLMTKNVVTTVNPVLSGHSKIDKTKILMTKCS